MGRLSLMFEQVRETLSISGRHCKLLNLHEKLYGYNVLYSYRYGLQCGDLE